MSGLRLKGEEGTENQQSSSVKPSFERETVEMQEELSEDWLEGPEPFVMSREAVDETIARSAQGGNGEVNRMTDYTESNKIVLQQKEMEEVAKEFSKVYASYYMDEKNDEDLLEYTTQPFWQSVRLSKNRLKQKGLKVEMDMFPEISNSKSYARESFKVNKRPMKYSMETKKDGQNEYGSSVTDVLIRRRFYKDGKRIYKKVMSEKHVATCLKSQVNGDQVSCPNCGYVNSVSTFIDGCDACGSRFTVKDFDSKVSGFSFEQNNYIQFKNLVCDTYNFIVILFLVMMAVMFAFMMIAPKFAETEWIASFGDISIRGFFSMFISIPIMLVVVTILAIVQWIMKLVYKSNIKGGEKASQVLHNISLNDFFQNLEYKLRNIHFSDKESEVNVFAKCNLSGAIAKYKDVIDCDMANLTFVDGKRTSDGYHFECQARIRMTKYNGKKITYDYEDVTLGVRGKKDVVDRANVLMRMYRCENCGSTLNLLEGAVCKYCGNEYDLEKYDWVIDKYEPKKKVNVVAMAMKVVVVVIYLGTLVLANHEYNLLVPENSTVIVNGQKIYGGDENDNQEEDSSENDDQDVTEDENE